MDDAEPQLSRDIKGWPIQLRTSFSESPAQNPSSSLCHSFKFLDVFLLPLCSCGASLPRRGSSRPELRAQCTFHPFVKALDSLTQMRLLIFKVCKLASIILLRSYFLFSFLEGWIVNEVSTRKFDQGFNAFETNTGKPHHLMSKQGQPNKRRDGATISLTNDHNMMWYGNISVGTPAAPYTGRSLFRAAQV